MPTTSNFGWTTPADTDLVKDGAAAIRTLGNGVDASFVDLKGGTTGQILSKASNADLDFTWSAAASGDITEVQAGVGISVASGTGPIPVITNSSTDLITTAGDLLYGTAADTVARLGIGTAGQVLKVNSGATAPEWGAATSTQSFTLLNAGGTSLTAASTITVNISSYNTLFVRVAGASTASASGDIRLRFNSDTGTNYHFYGLKLEGTSVTSDDGPSDYLKFAAMGNSAANTISGFLLMEGAASTGIKPYHLGTFAQGTTSNLAVAFHGYYGGSSAVTSVSIIAVSGGNFDAGTIYVYGAN